MDTSVAMWSSAVQQGDWLPRTSGKQSHPGGGLWRMLSLSAQLSWDPTRVQVQRMEPPSRVRQFGFCLGGS